MQSLDELLTDITSKTETLLRKLSEVQADNEKLLLENNKLKQELTECKNVDLFSTKPTEDTTADVVQMKQDIESCIREVKQCISLLN